MQRIIKIILLSTLFTLTYVNICFCEAVGFSNAQYVGMVEWEIDTNTSKWYAKKADNINWPSTINIKHYDNYGDYLAGEKVYLIKSPSDSYYYYYMFDNDGIMYANTTKNLQNVNGEQQEYQIAASGKIQYKNANGNYVDLKVSSVRDMNQSNVTQTEADANSFKQVVQDVMANYENTNYSQEQSTPVTINGNSYDFKKDCSGFASACFMKYVVECLGVNESDINWGEVEPDGKRYAGRFTCFTFYRKIRTIRHGGTYYYVDPVDNYELALARSLPFGMVIGKDKDDKYHCMIYTEVGNDGTTHFYHKMSSGTGIQQTDKKFTKNGNYNYLEPPMKTKEGSSYVEFGDKRYLCVTFK